MSYITFSDVCKDYGQGTSIVHAADHVSFGIEQGELCVVLGPSGAGKTTILNLLGGMDKATSGIIRVSEKEITAMRSPQLTQYRRLDVGFVFQFYNLMPSLTALENVELARQVCPRSLDPETVLAQVGLQNRMGNFPAQLSGGEQQRVSIARALCKNPALLLCDEPTGALDSKASARLMKMFEGVHNAGQTLVMVTHSAQAAGYASRVLFIKDGQVYNQLYRGDATRERFYQQIIATLTALTDGGVMGD